MLRSWDRNPRFYVDQTLGAYFESLLAPPPFSRARDEQIARMLEAPLGTVLSRLHRGRKLFEKALWDHAEAMGVLERGRVG